MTRPDRHWRCCGVRMRMRMRMRRIAGGGLLLLSFAAAAAEQEQEAAGGPEELRRRLEADVALLEGGRPGAGRRRRRAEDNNDGADEGNDDEYKYYWDGDNENASYIGGNLLCSKFLLNFLSGTTDTSDTCKGIKNAYLAADCTSGLDDEAYADENPNDDSDDYLNNYNFSAHSCCQPLSGHYGTYCSSDEGMVTNIHMMFAMVVLLLSEVAKNLLKRLDSFAFVPEAGICILVGTICGALASLLPGKEFQDVSFDEGLFMQILLPPIIFEASLSVSKRQFKRSSQAIMVFAVIGTVFNTFVTGLLVHHASRWTDYELPLIDSLVFGALISSIDPVAILSLLSRLGLTQNDTVYIVVFGESLLNDGISITVFKTLVNRFNIIDEESSLVSVTLGVAADFVIAMVGSIAVALGAGVLACYYFWFLKRTLSPAMEAGSFFLWAVIPFFLSEALQWSGIVSLVVMGMFMDVYIASPKIKNSSVAGQGPPSISTSGSDLAGCLTGTFEDGLGTALPTSPYYDMGEGDDETVHSQMAQSVAPLRGTNRIRLSPEADRHIRFVAHIGAQLSENAIFAYLGLFLFSSNYNWKPALMSIGITSCMLSRTVMVLVLSQFVLLLYKVRGRFSWSEARKTAAAEKAIPDDGGLGTPVPSGESRSGISQTALAIRDMRTQAVLVLSGLRGAVSLALVESVPIYNGLTGEGCQHKPLLKGMTSAAIIFTTFVLGGTAYFVLPLLGFGHDVDDANHGGAAAPASMEMTGTWYGSKNVSSPINIEIETRRGGVVPTESIVVSRRSSRDNRYVATSAAF